MVVMHAAGTLRYDTTMGTEEKEGKETQTPTFAGMIHMLGDYKGCFLRLGLSPILVPEGDEEGGTSIL